MKKVIVVKWQANNYFMSFMKSDCIYQLYKTHDYQKACKQIGKLGYENIPLGKWTKELKNVDIVVFFDSFLNNRAIELVKQVNNKAKVVLYFWNKINKNNEHLLNNKLIDEFYTFDEEDSKKYAIKYNAQFYTDKIKLKSVKEKYDICFLGRDKGRSETINQLIDVFNKCELKQDIRVINDERNFMPYKKYLKMIENSKCILDIVSNNQKGASLRVMESIFFKKKLITNNTNVVNYDFYDKQNIFVIKNPKKVNLSELQKFINSSYKDIDQKIIDYYKFENWLYRFEK